MEYRNLGRSGLKVSPICLGTMMFGGQTDETTAQRIADRGRDAGVNFIDTADAYNHGASEQITGRLIAKDRNSWVLATKVANPMGPSANERGLSKKWVLQAAEASLRRLRYRLHRRLLPPQGGPRHTFGRNGASNGGSHAARQDSLLWRVELPVVASSGDLSPVRRGWD